MCENEVSDADAGVKELTEDLRTMKLVTAGVLTSSKQNYLFEGIGHLTSTIFIGSTLYLKRININGVKKMCVVRERRERERERMRERGRGRVGEGEGGRERGEGERQKKRILHLIVVIICMQATRMDQ